METRPHNDSPANRNLEGLVFAMVLGVGVYLLAWLAIEFTRRAGGVASVWPVNAVVLASLLRSPRRRWPVLLVAGLAGNAAAGIAAGGGEWLTPLCLALSNATEIIIAVLVLRLFAEPDIDLSRRRDLFLFAAAALAATLASAAVSSLLLAAQGHAGTLGHFTGWIMVDGLGLVIVTPALLALRAKGLKALWAPDRRWRAVFILAALVAVVAAISLDLHTPFRFLMIPVLLFLTFELGTAGAAIGVLVTAMLMLGMAATTRSGGSNGPSELAVHSIELQAFLAVVAATTLTVATAMAERRRLKTSLAATAQRFQMLTENAGDMVTQSDLTGRFVYLSPALTRISGYQPEEMIGRSALSLVHPDDRPALLDVCQRQIASGGSEPPQRVRYRCSHKDGRTIWFEAQPTLLVDPNTREPLGFTDVIRDITETVRIEEQLTASEERYRLLADHATDVVIRVDMHDVILYASPAVRRYGYEPDELVGQCGYTIVHPEDLEKLRGLIGALFSNAPVDRGADRDYRLRTKNGDFVWMEGSPSIVRDDEGQPIEVISSLRDITARKETEKALADSEARYRQLAENATDVIASCAPDGVITYVSPAARRVFGYEPEELIGRQSSDLIYPEDYPDVVKRILQFAASGKTEDIRYRVIKKNGDVIWIEANPSIVTDPATGKVVALNDFSRDITDRKAMEDTIAASEARYRLLAENTTDIIVRYDVAGVIEFASPAVRRLGYEPEQIVGRNMADFVSPEDQTLTQRHRKAVLAGDPAVAGPQTEARARRADGEWVWLESNPSPVHDADGKVIGVVTTLRDVTTRRKMDEALAESETRYRMLADISTDIIVRYDASAVIEYVSPAARQLGYEPEALVGRRMVDFVHPETGVESLERLIDAIAAGTAGEDTRVETRVRRTDGEFVWLEGNPAPIHDEAGMTTGGVIVLRDITARRAMEEELRHRQTEAEAATVAKTEFLANMSHEIRTPLTGIIGFAGLMEEVEGLSPTAAKYANRITTASRTLLSVVNDILDFSKIEAGQIALDPEPFDPAAFVGETIELAAGQAAAKGLTLRGEIQGALPPGVNADCSRIRQVLLNLIGNAIKFTSHGEVSVVVSYLAAETKGGGMLRIAVSDTGVGIPKDALERLFQRFSQVDGSISRRFGGTGLGLAICKSLTELMGGKIGVESREGLSSTFWFTVAAPPADLAEPAAAQDDVDWGGAPARILVVDDVAVNRELVSVMLSPFGHQLVEAASGTEAVEAAMHEAFDLILMDLQMPGMDGLAATRAIREGCEYNRATPIVALSADVMPIQLQACRAAGMDDHIAKPIDPAELLYKVALWTTPAEVAPVMELAE